MPLFKIWTCNRDQKALFYADEKTNLYENLILKASTKFKLDGEKLVLEKDGSLVDDDDVLWELSVSPASEILMILTKTEVWLPLQISAPNTPSSFLSDATTLTNSTVSYTPSLGEMPESSDADGPPIILYLDDANDVDLNDGINANSRSSTFSAAPVRNEFTWSTYQIPWNNIPDYMLQSCEKGIRDRHILTRIIHTVVDDVRKIKTDISSNIFRIISKKIIDKYPTTFRDIDEDGVVLGDGTYSLFTKLKERNNYLNRPHKRKNVVSSTFSSTKSPKQIKRLIDAKAGCIEWQPQSCSNEESADGCNETSNAQNDSTIFREQRSFLNNIERPPTIIEIKNKFPDLTKTKKIFEHFEKLTAVNVQATMDGIYAKSEKILKFAETKKLKPITDITSDLGFQCIEVFALYFKEDIKVFYKQLKDIEEMKTIIDGSPCVVKIENENGRKMYVCMENEIVDQEGHSSDLEAALVAFVLYFNFNLQYQKAFCTTMEMIQRYFFKIHPDSGSKSKKTSVAKKRAIAFIKKLNN